MIGWLGNWVTDNWVIRIGIFRWFNFILIQKGIFSKHAYCYMWWSGQINHHDLFMELDFGRLNVLNFPALNLILVNTVNNQVHWDTTDAQDKLTSDNGLIFLGFQLNSMTSDCTIELKLLKAKRLLFDSELDNLVDGKKHKESLCGNEDNTIIVCPSGIHMNVNPNIGKRIQLENIFFDLVNENGLKK